MGKKLKENKQSNIVHERPEKTIGAKIKKKKLKTDKPKKIKEKKTKPLPPNKILEEDDEVNKVMDTSERIENSHESSKVRKNKLKKTQVHQAESLLEKSSTLKVLKKLSRKLKDTTQNNKSTKNKRESNKDPPNIESIKVEAVQPTEDSDQEESKKKPRHDSKPENTIFVGNLPSNTKKNQLSAIFKQFGNVVSIRFRTIEGKKIFKHATRKKSESLNAYIVFDNTESKEKALSLSGEEFKGRHIRVTAAKDFTGNVISKSTIFVGNLKYSATDEKLYDIFSTCGELDYIRTIRNNKGCTGVAYVCFKKPEAVTLALELNNTILDERPIRVQRYRKNETKTKDGPKTLTGPARRLEEKKKKFLAKQPLGKKNKNATDKTAKSSKKEKKSDYHGKRMSAMKKKQKTKRKNSTHLEKLAKKIAPK